MTAEHTQAWTLEVQDDLRSPHDGMSSGETCAHGDDACGTMVGMGLWIDERGFVRRRGPVDVDDRGGAVPVDELMPREAVFFEALQSHCVVECCGLDAFDFSPTNVVRAAGQRAPELQASFRRSAEAIRQRNPRVAVSGQLNQLLQGADLIDLMQHVADCLASPDRSAPIG